MESENFQYYNMTKEEFINLNTMATASILTTNTATFIGINKIDRSEIQQSIIQNFETTLENSLFFINGVNIYSSIVSSINNSGNNLVVTFDTASIGYDIESADKVLSIGKFKQV